MNSAGIILINFLNRVETTEEEWDWVAAVNPKGAFLASRDVVKRIPPGGGSRIVNIATTVVATTLPDNAAYTASNVAVESFTKTLAKDSSDEEEKFVESVSGGLEEAAILRRKQCRRQ